jgi:hypothetical protein
MDRAVTFADEPVRERGGRVAEPSGLHVLGVGDDSIAAQRPALPVVGNAGLSQGLLQVFF